MQVADTVKEEKRQKTVWHFKPREDEKGVDKGEVKKGVDKGEDKKRVDKGEDGNVILKQKHDAVYKSKNSNNRKF
jgi:hypothetical protein